MDRFITQEVIIFVLLEHLVAIYVSPRGVVLLWCIMYGIYVHIKAITYVTNKQDFLPKLIRQKYKRKCQTHIYSWCMPLYCLCCTTLPIEYGVGSCLLKNAERSLRYHVKRELPKQELWTNKWCHNALCIEILLIYGIINLHNYMY